MEHIFKAEELMWLWPGAKSIIIFSVGYITAKFLSNLSSKTCQKYASPQQCMVLKKAVFFGILFLFLISALQQLGFKLSILLGSAGIASAAIGFASKTTISNMISGVFLIIEKSFSVGDQIKVRGITGIVDSIDLLSVKLVTPDNTLVRVPNETILRTEVVNLTKFPKRRLDIIIGVAYNQNIEEIRDALTQLTNENTLSLDKPIPTVTLTEFAESAINLRLSVWVKKKDFGALKNALPEDIKKLCDANTIDMPYPQLTVHMIND